MQRMCDFFTFPDIMTNKNIYDNMFMLQLQIMLDHM